MSRTHKHTIPAKFKNGIIAYKDIPIKIRKQWRRVNFEVGHFRNLRNKQRYKLEKDFYHNEVNQREIYNYWFYENNFD